MDAFPKWGDILKSKDYAFNSEALSDMKGDVYWKLIPFARSLSSFSFFHLLTIKIFPWTPGRGSQSFGMQFRFLFCVWNEDTIVYLLWRKRYSERSPPLSGVCKKVVLLITLPKNVDYNYNTITITNTVYKIFWWFGCHITIQIQNANAYTITDTITNTNTNINTFEIENLPCKIHWLGECQDLSLVCWVLWMK